ncbi:two component transcriptional regulator [Caballeronia terrestris]|uniref:Two component transcriptional regulator n=1 Tax=Caballeronia terrestris TaxID=1226301 RepID=A0A158KPY9_9BURK|nr:two component transcriptional regulator [Caballeronia terrestris]
MRVLMVEGDLQIGRNLFRELKEAHYTVDWIRHGKADNVTIVSTCYAAVLLDLGPSAVGGMNMLKALRAAGNPVPVLSLTARDARTCVCAASMSAPTIACSNPLMFQNFWPACEQCCGAGLVAQHRGSEASHSASISRSARYIAMVLHRPFLPANSP